MELGVLGLDGFQSLDGETSKHKWGSAARSGGFRLEGSGFFPDDLRSSKIPRTDGDYSSSSSSTQQLLQSARNVPLRPLSSGASDANMLSFSSCDKSESSALPYFQQVPTTKTTTGYYSGALSNSAGMYLLNGVRGPFTPSQWLELEQQALIYKYMTVNEPIPAQLLIPIKKAFESAGLFGFTGATLRPTPWGWGPFHLGYSNSNDPEPGRCRRTDGKKWRCSRDAMPDQKYCERHMNRGRHRSRKHVEGQAKSTPATTTTTPTTTSYTPTPSAMAPEAGLSNTFDMTHHYHQQAKNSQHSSSINPLLNSCQGLQDSSQHSFLSLSGESMYPIPKHRNSNQEFTITTSQKNSGFCCGNDNSTQGLNSTDGSSLLWPGLQSQLDTTQLSMSHHQLEMGLGVGEQTHTTSRQTSWIPSSWEPSMGGPLGEALQSGNGDGKRTSSSVALNLLPKGWDAMGNYQVSSSSPTGVLQKSALVSSMSNSSAGSSPRGADNSKTIEGGGSLCNDLH